MTAPSARAEPAATRRIPSPRRTGGARKIAAVALPLALLLAGCPITQPLPDYPAGTITPPRILTASLTIKDTVVFVPAGCANTDPGPAYELGAQLYDTNNIEQVQARWFVNYPDRQDPVNDPIVSPDPDPLVLTRVVPPFTFHPYRFPPPFGSGFSGTPPFNKESTTRVVELIVSNKFYEPPDQAPEPWRSPADNFETQLQRWTFLLVPGTGPACP